ncbi:hypothetical protein [Roseovarius indicus]|uniref:hypothetical protein n=1 Tax=Roseovarius indicus TaxID=540747 RepID=UPI0032ED60C3
MPEKLATNPDVAAAQRKMLLDDINRTISLSEARCLSFDTLLERVERLWEDPQASEIVYHLCEMSLSTNQEYALAESARRLADSAEYLPSSQKQRCDRAIKRILSRMQAKVAAPIAEQWLQHKRKFRREISYNILRKCGLTASSGPRLLDVFHATHDQQALELIARFPVAAGNIDIPTIIDQVDEEYWRMRMVQAALESDKEKALKLAELFPREFTNAAGRLKDTTLMPKLRELLIEHAEDLDFLSVYAWALGQFKASGDLKELKIHIDTIK